MITSISPATQRRDTTADSFALLCLFVRAGCSADEAHNAADLADCNRIPNQLGLSRRLDAVLVGLYLSMGNMPFYYKPEGHTRKKSPNSGAESTHDQTERTKTVNPVVTGQIGRDEEKGVAAVPDQMIDRTNYIPFHVQVSDSLKVRIQTRAWLPGQRLPSELDLCDQYNVSRSVVREALLELVHQGYVVRRRGHGTFVADAKAKLIERLAPGLYGFYEEMEAQGLSPSSRLVCRRIGPATTKIAHKLDIEIGAPPSEICQILVVQGQPLAMVSSYWPEPYSQALWNVDLTNRSLHDLVESKFKVSILRARLVIDGACVSEGAADLLEISPGDPVIRLEGTSHADDGRPVEYFEAYHRGDRTCLEIELVRQANP